MTIYLHIGTSKTGTSTIQRFLAANRPRLHALGYTYPRSPGDRNHTMLAIYAGDPEKTLDLRIAHPDVTSDPADLDRARREFEGAFVTECRSARNVVLSNEHCYTRLSSDETVGRLRDLLVSVDPDVRVICYLRRQDEHLLSGYSTAVVSGGTESLDLDEPMVWPELHNYHTALDRWARVFGEEQLIVRVYERDRWAGGDIITDLLDAIGIDEQDDFEAVSRVNESLDAVTVEFLRLFNREIPRIQKGKINPIRRGLVGQLSKLATGPRLELATDVAERYVARYADENRLVAERFLDPPAKSLFDASYRSSQDAAPALDVEQAVAIGAALFRWRSRNLLKVERALADVEGQLKETEAELDRARERLAAAESVASQSVVPSPDDPVDSADDRSATSGTRPSESLSLLTRARQAVDVLRGR